MDNIIVTPTGQVKVLRTQPRDKATREEALARIKALEQAKKMQRKNIHK